MNDLISRQAAIDVVRNIIPDNRSIGICEELEQLPPIQPEIIRCKDCKHYQFADNRAFGFPVKQCERTGFEDVDANDFCSRGERREVTE